LATNERLSKKKLVLVPSSITTRSRKVAVWPARPFCGRVTENGTQLSPALAFDPPFALAVAACAVGLLLLAVLVESVGRRRDRLAEVLRVGDAR